MLIDGEIHPSDWLQAARFIALISQSEGVKPSPDLLSEHNQSFVTDLSRRIQRVAASAGAHTRQTFLDVIRADSGSDKDSEHSHLDKFIIENYLEHMVAPDDTETTPEPDMPDNFFLMVALEHQRIHTMTTSSAKYWLLEEFATLRKFGEELFEGALMPESTTTSGNSKVAQTRSETIQIAVSPQGLSVRKIESKIAFSIPFSAVESAKSLRRCFHLCYLDEDFAVSNIVVKFTSHRIAGTLYRSLTEKHAFYSCETVHKNVETQFIRDLKVSEAA